MKNTYIDLSSRKHNSTGFRSASHIGLIGDRPHNCIIRPYFHCDICSRRIVVFGISNDHLGLLKMLRMFRYHILSDATRRHINILRCGCSNDPSLLIHVDCRVKPSLSWLAQRNILLLSSGPLNTDKIVKNWSENLPVSASKYLKSFNFQAINHQLFANNLEDITIK
jgi:hypothetical protein